MKYLNHISFFIFLYSKACKEPSVSSTFDMLSSISGDVNWEGCKQSFARARGADKFKGIVVSKVDNWNKCKEEV